VLPLLGQMVGVGVEFRLGLPFISGCMVIGKITAILSAWLTIRLKNKLSAKACMIMGFSMLFPRCAAIVAVSRYANNNIWALATTQLLDGFGAAMVGLSLIICTNIVSLGTGRFSSVFGTVMLGEAIGAASSNLLGGYLADHNFQLAFIVLGLIAILPIMTFGLGVSVYEPENFKADLSVIRRRLSVSMSYHSKRAFHLDRSVTPVSGILTAD